MNTEDMDPNFLLPLWRELVSYFRHYRPLLQAEQHLDAKPQTARGRR